MRNLLWLVVVALCAGVCSPLARGQSVLGKHPSDTFTAGFFGQNQNADKIITGLNTYGTIPLNGAGGGGSQTPWSQNINGNGFGLTGANYLGVTGGTITTQPGALVGSLINLNQRWNNAGTTFQGFHFNVTNTASAAGSLIFVWRINNTDFLDMDVNGDIHFGGSLIGLGSGLTGLNGSAVTSGTIPEGRLTVAEQSAASASTTDLSVPTTRHVLITGTTTITSFGTATAGTWRWVRMGGALTLTHNGTSLILPNGGANITTAAGDSFMAFSLGSGNWKVYGYWKADGTPVSTVGLLTAVDNLGSVSDATAALNNLGGASKALHYITDRSESGLTAEQNLGALATGTLQQTVSGGVATVATQPELITSETDVASATTTDLGSVSARNVRITGTTTITGFGTVAAGVMRWGRFAGALTLTHNATSLILPSGANITTAAGDRFAAVSLGSGNWLVYVYQKSDGTALVGGAGGGDFSSNTGTSVDGEFVLFSGTGGKTGKRATGTGVVHASSGVYSVGNVNLVSEVTGTLPIGNGGTGQTTANAARDALEQTAEATLASASTTDLGAQTSQQVSVTGTTTITSFGTVAAGTLRWVRFTGALTLTHNASSLILPGGANITTAAGDRLVARSEGSGNWRVWNYIKADGSAIVASDYKPGGTDVAIADGGTGASTAAAALDNLITAEANVASASTTDLGAQTTRNVNITGTTTITSFGTVASGVMRWGRFGGALTLTHNGTSLILPNNGNNITTAAGDRFAAISLGSGNWLVYFYQKANGAPLVGATAPGSDKNVIFNDGGVLGADAGVNYDKTTDTLMAGAMIATNGVATGGSGTFPGTMTLFDADRDTWLAIQAPATMSGTYTNIMPGSAASGYYKGANSSGTVTISQVSTIPIADGGTGQTTANAARDALEQTAEATLASASTTDLGAQTSQQVSVTGTTTITSFGTVAAGTLRFVRFTGALTLTHNSSSLILPGGANITTAAGDRLMARSEGSGNWRVWTYFKADGTAIVSSDYKPGGTDVAVADGGTGASTAAAALDSLITAEANVASASTTDLGAQTTRNVNITGTTTITSFGTVAAGVMRWGRFGGALTLTHNATSLILPSGANITTAANDRFAAISLGSGNWLVYFYQKADGTALVGGAGGGDFSSNTSTSVDSEVVLFSGTGGKTGKRATGTGMAKLTSGVLSTGTAGTDYLAPSSTIVKSMFVPVGWMIDGSTAPDAIATFTTGSRKVNVRKFSNSADNLLDFFWQIPVDATDGNGGTGDFQMKWRPIYIITESTAPASNEGVTFGLQGASVADDEAYNATLGTESDSSIANLSGHAQGDLVYGPYSEITVTGGAAGEGGVFSIRRDQADTNDDYAQKVGLIGVEFKYVAILNASY